MLAITLALASSLVYGLSDFLGGLKSRSAALLPVLLISQGSALIVLLAIVIPSGEGPPGDAYLLYAVLAGVSEAVGVAALYRGLASGVISIVAPVAAAAPAVPVVAAVLLGEIPAPIQAAGVGLAVAGIVLTACERSGEDLAAGAVTTSVLFGLLSAIGFGCFYVAMDAASEGDVPWALLLARVTAVALFVTAFLVRPVRFAMRPAELPVIASIGALIVAADSMYAIASTKGSLSVTAVLSSLYPIVTITLAYVILDERIDRHRQLGIAAVLCGVAAISIG